MKHTHTSYGVFLGGDPRTFEPDPEVCTDAEIAAWWRACQQAKQGEPVGGDPPGWTCAMGVKHPFGFGVNTWNCDETECEDEP